MYIAEGFIFIAYLDDLENWPLLVNQKYWGGSSLTGLTGLTVSNAPDFPSNQLFSDLLSLANALLSRNFAKKAWE